MITNLAEEIANYCKQSRNLRRLLEDTLKCFKDVNSVKYQNGVDPLRAEFTHSEQEEADELTSQFPAFCIGGRSTSAKAFVANELLQKEILPYDVSKTSPYYSQPWRRVDFVYGEYTNFSHCLPGSFELLKDDDHYHDEVNTIPISELVLPENEQETSDKWTAAVEVRLNHPLLTDGARVTVMPQSSEEMGISTIYHFCTKDSVPVVIYAISDNILLGEDVNELKELKEVFPDMAMFFVKVPTVISLMQSPRALSPPGRSSSQSRRTRSRSPSASRSSRSSSRQRSSRHQERQNEPSQLYPAARSKSKSPKPHSAAHSKSPPLSPTRQSSSVTRNSRPTSPKPKHTSTSLLSVRKALELNKVDQNFVSQHNSFTITQRMSPSLGLFQQLLDIGYLSLLPSSGGRESPADGGTSSSPDADSGCYAVIDSELVENLDGFSNLVPFVHNVLQRKLLETVSFLNVIHVRCVQNFILKAFDMARDMLITPKRLEFARSKETALYSSLMEIALKKQTEIRDIIHGTIVIMRDDLLLKAEQYEFTGLQLEESGEVRSSADLKTCTAQIQELILGDLNAAIAAKLLGSVDILRDSYTGVLTRCLESLEQSDGHSLEAARTSLALREILTAAYQVEITVRSGTSIVKILLEKMKQLLHSMPWHSTPRIDRAWKRQVAADMIDSLSDTRLAKSICSQIKERLKQSHETFSSALKQLEARHSGRLESTEEHRMKVRKVHAPRVARLALESTSLKDFTLYGVPKMGREIGRGQYGVVYSCEKWGPHGPCAVKTVVPPDDKHWNDLALEFYYTKHVPGHPRIVPLLGSVVDYSYSGGNAAVLLVMARLQRDLYTGIKNGLDWLARLQVAIDVVEGIRYLHSQGLVHRDIKLKNVLLDRQNRGCLTDLGFCKPEAMMSGSIVGTPIHMAPELFTGRYDSSVDVYAFGVLFWYVSAGHVRLPKTFEQCANKEMLWTSVRRGVRPEHLPQFDPECWDLMQQCWHNSPTRRPLLGNVQPQLMNIYKRFSSETLTSSTSSKPKTPRGSMGGGTPQKGRKKPGIQPLPVL